MAKVKQSDVALVNMLVDVVKLLEQLNRSVLALESGLESVRQEFRSASQSYTVLRRLDALLQKVENLSAVYSDENRKRIDAMFEAFIDELYNRMLSEESEHERSDGM